MLGWPKDPGPPNGGKFPRYFFDSVLNCQQISVNFSKKYNTLIY